MVKCSQIPGAHLPFLIHVLFNVIQTIMDIETIVSFLLCSFGTSGHYFKSKEQVISVENIALIIEFNHSLSYMFAHRYAQKTLNRCQIWRFIEDYDPVLIFVFLKLSVYNLQLQRYSSRFGCRNVRSCFAAG